ncbi:uncharacterized protein LOC127139318 [Lates calcarifer]|uniref:Uncharacterized protein LOC127139318 n=1 Tax=Lates calcarifer TaxID=8187 RepID=A0AAJ8AZR4_LATCA|nr:uncharacterized protein LOC127139318 [Lates calcarifer]
MQVNNSTNSTEDAEVEDTVAFPNDLYSQASKASAEDKLGFTVQVLEEMAVLFEEDHSAASWEESTVKDFVNIVTQQADGLHSCTGSHSHKKKNKKLHMYFKRLSGHVLERMVSLSIYLWTLGTCASRSGAQIASEDQMRRGRVETTGNTLDGCIRHGLMHGWMHPTQVQGCRGLQPGPWRLTTSHPESPPVKESVRSKRSEEALDTISVCENW